MSAGTRAALRRDEETRIAELEAKLLTLGGREHKAERSRVNRELWALQQPAAASQSSPAMQQGGATAPDELPPLAAHWMVLHPSSEAGPALCVRCGSGAAHTCRFHPDAKAFAFGTGRFDYGYTSLWDTPHDRWFCCGGATAESPGCCEEASHRTDPAWWQAYAHLSPPLDADADESDGEASSEESSERGSDNAEAMDLT